MGQKVMNDQNFELGYTPNNLKKILLQNNLLQKDARVVIGKCRNAFSRYLYDVSHPNHVSMSHSDWLKILEYVKTLKRKK